MTRSVQIFGAGPYARLLRRFAESLGRTVSGFVVDAEYSQDCDCDGLPVHVWGEGEVSDAERYNWLVGTGYRSMVGRADVAGRISASGATLDTLVAPSAFVAGTALVEPGCVIFHSVVVEDMCRLGRNNVLWTGSIIAHDTTVGNDNYFSPGVTLSGNCRVGSRCFFGTRSGAANSIEVVDDCLIAAGAMLVSSATTPAAYRGLPAKAFRTIDPGVGVQVLH